MKDEGRYLFCVGGPRDGQKVWLSYMAFVVSFPTPHPEPMLVWNDDELKDIQVEFSVDEYALSIVVQPDGTHREILQWLGLRPNQQGEQALEAT